MRDLLMLPGPTEISFGVQDALSGPPPSHTDPALVTDFARALQGMRQAWLAGPDDQPFAVGGGGTLAVESAVANLFEPGDRVLLVNTGLFADRMADMLWRRGVEVVDLRAEPGQAPDLDELRRAVEGNPGLKAICAVHVDTSTGVRIDLEQLCGFAREHDLLSVIDGVASVAAEELRFTEWGADVVATASQKAIGLPPGLGLWVASPRALATRDALRMPPPLTLDWHAWRPIMRSYEDGAPQFFSTPPTPMIRALATSLDEIFALAPTPQAAMELRFERHARASEGMRGAWQALGLELVPAEGLAAHSLSALYLPQGVGPELIARVRERGVQIAGGLHPTLRDSTFRVGHMGVVAMQVGDLAMAVRAIAGALTALGQQVDETAAIAALGLAFED